LKEIYKNIPVHHSNIDELKTIWKEYINLLETEFPEISIDHDGDTICIGELSSGCLFCKNGLWIALYHSNCNLNCEFCISPFMQHSKIPISAYGKTAEDMIRNYKRADIKGISFSGGEPFLNFEEMITHFEALKKNCLTTTTGCTPTAYWSATSISIFWPIWASMRSGTILRLLATIAQRF